MATAELSRRVEKVVGHPPLSEMGEPQRREFHEALLEAGWLAAKKAPDHQERVMTAAFRPKR